MEWDILFLMLERRSTLTNDISRIQRVTLPFVPVEFRSYLSALLLGEKRRPPRPINLSLDATREVILAGVARAALPAWRTCGQGVERSRSPQGSGMRFLGLPSICIPSSISRRKSRLGGLGEAGVTIL